MWIKLINVYQKEEKNHNRKILMSLFRTAIAFKKDEVNVQDSDNCFQKIDEVVIQDSSICLAIAYMARTH